MSRTTIRLTESDEQKIAELQTLFGLHTSSDLIRRAITEMHAAAEAAGLIQLLRQAQQREPERQLTIIDLLQRRVGLEPKRADIRITSTKTSNSNDGASNEEITKSTSTTRASRPDTNGRPARKPYRTGTLGKRDGQRKSKDSTGRDDKARRGRRKSSAGDTEQRRIPSRSPRGTETR